MIIDIQDLLDYGAFIQVPKNKNFLEWCIQAAEGLMVNYCGQKLINTEIKEWYDGSGSNVILLRQNLVTEINSINIYDRASNVTAVPSLDYRLTNFSKGYFVNYTYPFPVGRNNVEISIQSGFYTDNIRSPQVPADLKLVATEIAYLIFRDSEQNPSGKGGRIGIESISESSSGLITSNIKFKDLWESRWGQMLYNYRVPLF